MSTPSPLNGKGINEQNELDCLRQLVLLDQRISNSDPATATQQTAMNTVLGTTGDAASTTTGTISAKLRQIAAGLATIATSLVTSGIFVKKQAGAIHANPARVTVDDTAGGTVIVGTDTTRRGVLIKNLSTDTIVYIDGSGDSPDVAVSYPLGPGESISGTAQQTWQGICDTGESAAVAALDEIDS